MQENQSDDRQRRASGQRSNAAEFIISGQFDPKFQVEGVAPNNYFCAVSEANECPTTLSMTIFTQGNFVAGFLQANCDFRRKMAVLRFCAPFGGLSNVR